VKFIRDNRLIAALIIMIALAIALAAASFAVAGEASPVSRTISALLAPVQKGMSTIGGGILSLRRYMGDFDALAEENKQLRAELYEKDALIRRAEGYREENERLRALIGLKQERRDFELENAAVTGWEEGSWSSVFYIDKGRRDGIALDNSVITEDGFVGFVTDLGDRWAEVTTVIDTGMVAGAAASRTREVGVCEGDFTLMKEGKLKFSYLDKATEVSYGDSVVTSGLGGQFPKGLLVGRVTEVRTEPHGISAYAVIQPAAKLENLTQVFVIKAFEIEG